MTALPHIVLCTEADAVVGLGHAVRCAGLLRSLAVAHRLSVVGGGPLLQRLFPQAEHIQAQDWTQLDWARLPLERIDLVLADIPYQRPRDWDRVRFAGAPLIVLDDHGGSVPADLVVNGTVLPAYHRYDPVRPPGRVCAGAPYALVRPEFAATPWRAATPERITIVAGSGEAARDWVLDLARELRPLQHAERIQLVVGDAFDALPTLRAACAHSGIALQVGLAAAPLAELLADSAVALITAGMVLYEAVAAGVPTVAFPQIADLVPEAAWFAERGACIDLQAGGGSAAAAAAAVNRLLDSSQAAHEMSHAQRVLLDGKGMARVARLLGDYLE